MKEGKIILVTGVVQGVNFRASTKKTASMLGLQGWVENLPSGEVEIHVFGIKKDLDKLLQWCQHGPPSAKVESVQAQPWQPAKIPLDFDIKR